MIPDDQAPLKPVATILPYRADGRILMQLRDEKAGIAFPGQWGFFGGTIEPGETPEAAARRELAEEVGILVEQFLSLGQARSPDVQAHTHAFACRLDTPREQLVLGEGMDMAWISLEEMLSGSCYSPRLRRSYPVVPAQFLPSTYRKLLAIIGSPSSSLDTDKLRCS